MDETTVAEELAMALGMALVRKGALDVDDIAEAAERAEEDGGEHGSTVAHLLNCILIQAQAPRTSDWQAERRRAQMRVVPSDGGNEN